MPKQNAISNLTPHLGENTEINKSANPKSENTSEKGWDGWGLVEEFWKDTAQARELLAMLLLFVKVRSTRSHSNLLAEGARGVLGETPKTFTNQTSQSARTCVCKPVTVLPISS